MHDFFNAGFCLIPALLSVSQGIPKRFEYEGALPGSLGVGSEGGIFLGAGTKCLVHLRISDWYLTNKVSTYLWGSLAPSTQRTCTSGDKTVSL